MPRNKLRAYGLPFILLFLLAVSILLFFNDLIQRPAIQGFILDRASEALGFHIRAEALRLDVGNGLALKARGFRAWSRDGTEEVEAASLEIGLNGRELIRGRIVPTRFHLERPRVLLNPGGPALPGPSVLWIPKGTFLEKLAALGSVSVSGGEVRLSTIPYHLEALRFSLSERGDATNAFVVNLHGEVVSGEDRVPFSIRGTLHPRAGGTALETRAALAVEIRNLPAIWLSHYAPFGITGGRLSAEFDLTGSLGATVRARGSLNLNHFKFFITGGERRKDYRFPRAILAFEALRKGWRLQFPRLELRMAGASVNAGLVLDLKERNNPWLALRISHPFMDLQTFKALMPTPILPEAVEDCYVPLFSKADVRIESLRLKGTLSQIKHLDRPANYERFSLKLRMKEGLALQGLGGMPVEKVAGSLLMQRGGLSLEGVSGHFGTSFFKKGSLRIPDLFREPSRFSIAVEGDYDLEDLARQAELEFTPAGVRDVVSKIDYATGRLEGCFRADFRGESFPWVREGTFRFRGARLFQEAFTYPLLLDDATVRVRGKGECDFEGEGSWGGSLFHFSGRTGAVFTPAAMKLSGSADLAQLWTRFFSEEAGIVRGEGPRPFVVDLKKNGACWRAAGHVDLSGSRFGWGGVSVILPPEDRVLYFKVAVREGVVDFQSLRWSQGESWAEAKGVYDTRQRQVGRIEVRARDFILDHGIKIRGEDLRHVRGTVSGKLRVDAPQGDVPRSVTGRITAREISLVKGEWPVSWKVDLLDARLTGRKISLPVVEVRLGDVPLRIRGTLEGWHGFQGDLKIEGEGLDLSMFSPPGGEPEGEKPGPLLRFLKRSQVGIRAEVKKGRWKGLSFDSLEAGGRFQAGALFIEGLQAQAPHWRLRASGRLGNDSTAEKMISCHVRMEEQPLEDLLKALGVQKPYVEGRCTAEVLLFTRGRGKRELLSGLSGMGVLVLEEGRLRESNVMIKILDALSLQNLFKERPPDLSGEGLYYESISGTMFLDRGILRTSDLMMQSPVFNAAAKGYVDFPRGNLSFDIGTQPLGTMDTLLSMIPVVGYILTGKEKSLLVYYFRVDGPLRNPDVRYVPLKNWGSGIIDFFKRIFFTPRRLLRKLTDMVNSPYVENPIEKSPEE
ncbi:MAG: AsmA-like C-terminal domain-containing protein [Deltaproteobacteria bacterium]|nr:AsmA-like C-terminal domain-containing protein [Deltaproteobacteria bacterium]